VGDQSVRSWLADANLPGKTANGDTSTRKRITGVALRPGDRIRIAGAPDGGDEATLDYIEVVPAANTPSAYSPR
jgi:alpha-glucuronidase